MNYFAVCNNISAILAARVTALRSVTAEQAATQKSAPAGATAVVCFAGEQVLEVISEDAYSAEQTYAVVLMCRGATASDRDDGALMHGIIRALNGSRPLPEERGFLGYSGCDSDFEDNARYYTLTFKIKRVQTIFN
ncbi:MULTISPECIES: hypothetical protein [Delftia]|uniref:DUF3168 domain-containing protein n=2 Tax=Delftia TaxID=80865 RepID=A0A7T2W158_DELAC|nr:MULTISPECIES: hypothetical protein [Delftia]QPS09958.1 hypothetical protein I6G66_08150 [Delftia acidovorans]